ncbi:MAG: hypothetical protein AB1768_17765 [Pseudomonadota bacterium]|jgi:hypothetical protein
MLVFETIQQSAHGCVRVARIGNERGLISLLYRDNRGKVSWQFGLHDSLDTVSVSATRETAQTIFDGLLQAIDPERRLPRPQLPEWVRHCNDRVAA